MVGGRLGLKYNMRIGSFQLPNNLILAPMAGATDKPFRQLCRSLGAGLAVSEMISSNSALWGTRKTVRRLDFGGEQQPIVAQILGSNPLEMAAAAKVNSDNGAQIIDINMGCPAKKVCKADAGSALLRDEKLVARILRAVVTAVEVPVTLKIRTGWDSTSRNGVRIAQIAEQEGIAALTVHGRTRACGFSGTAEHDTARMIKLAVTIPVIANGDIDGPEKAVQVLRYSGVDGLMIGRAALGQPWIFRHISHYIQTGELLAPPQPEQVGELLCGHLRQLYSFYGAHQGVRIARKHIAWYSKRFTGGVSFSAKINTTDSTDEQLRLIRRFFVRSGTERGMAA